MVKKYLNVGSVRVLRETEKAVLCEFLDDGTNVWMPKSQVHPGCDIQHDGDEGELIVSVWIAQTKDIRVHEILTRADEEPEREEEPPAWSPLVVDLTKAKGIYRRLAMKYHPDRREEGDEIMRDINELWQEFLDATKQK